MNDAAIAPPGVMPSQQPISRRAQQRHPVARHLLPHLQHDAQADRGRVAAQREPLLHRQQDLADAEEADHGDQEVDAAQQRIEAEGHAQLAGDRVHADRRQQQAERHRDDRLVLRLAPQPDERAEREQVDGEEFRRPEAQRERRDARREERDQQHRDERADERRRERRGQRLGGLALLRHRIAVEGGRHRPRLAGNVEQDRRDRAAEQRAPVDARQHHDRRRRVHRERERQQDRDAVRAAEPRQHADEDAEHEARPASAPGSSTSAGRRSRASRRGRASMAVRLAAEQRFERTLGHDARRTRRRTSRT